MRVLVCAENIFSATGGGQSFYADLIGNYPEHEFWYFSAAPELETGRPVNAHAVRILSLYRPLENQLSIEQFAFGGYNLNAKKYDLLYMLDLASSVLAFRFDIVDVPDYMGYGAAFPAALRTLSVPFDRLAVSLHGTLAMGVTNNWAEVLSDGELRHLRELDDLLFRAADVRYAISSRYLGERESQTGCKGSLLDLTHLLPQRRFRAIRAKAEARAKVLRANSDEIRPTVTFIGRQEKWKGPDLFLDMVAGLPRAAYGSVEMIGPEIKVGGVGSNEQLSRMASRRSVEYTQRHIPREVLWEELAASRRVAVMPSRRDTLNLSALETLLTGTPTLVSTGAGVVDYLAKAFPGLPYDKMDPADLAGAKRKLLDLLDNFDERRTALCNYLDAHEPLASGGTLTEVYGEVDPAPEIGALYEAFSAALDHLMRGAVASARVRAREQLGMRIRDMFSGLLHEDELPEHVHYLTHALDRACELRPFAADKRAVSKAQGLLSDAQMEEVWEALQPFCYSADRVAVYRLLADLEKDRGNLLLYATYQVRCMRLGGGSTPELVDEVSAIIQKNGFPEEAEAVRWMYGDHLNYEAARAYLDASPRRFRAPPEGDIERVLDERTIDKPKVSIIVSLYRAASKMDVFFEGLARLTERTRGETEIVLVDSCSPDDTTAVVQRLVAEHRAAGWNVSVHYIRTSVRETIQRAWNRGIAAATGEYLSFLGVDEMNRSDAFEIMVDYLDAHPSVDWVQGTALVTEVNERGSFVQDLMMYDRRFDGDYLNLFDTCYIGYVGALYRKNIHERVGYYDDRFRGAGDSEFKNRALPYISAVTLPLCLGYFLNYPEERTTQSPMAEIEDIRAWYLFRTTAGVGYIFNQSTAGEIEAVIRSCIDYRKSYLEQRSTDLELATSIVHFIGRSERELNARFFAQGAFVKVARDMYRVLDSVSETTAIHEGVRFVHEVAEVIERAAFALATVQRTLAFAGLPLKLLFRNDNRSHQHHYTWRSRSQRIALELRGPLVDLAGPQDLAELLSACGAQDQNVDFERAQLACDLKQIHRLHAETALDIAIEMREQEAVLHLVDAIVAAVPQGAASFVLVGVRAPPGPVPDRVYFTGPVARPGPVIAAAGVLFVRAESRAPGSGAARLVRAIVSGKPFVSDTASVSELARLCPDVDVSAVIAIDEPAAAIAQAASFVRNGADPHQEASWRALAATLLANPMVEHRGFVAPALSRVVPLERIFAMNRAIRAAFTDGGREAVERLLAQASEDDQDILAALIDALFASKRAPILDTAQPIFRKINSAIFALPLKVARRGRQIKVARVSPAYEAVGGSPTPAPKQDPDSKRPNPTRPKPRKQRSM